MDKANNFHDYAKNEAEAKCGKLKGMTLMFEEEFLYKSQTLDEVKESYTWPIEFASAKEINDACMKGAPGKAVLIDVPCGTTVSPEDDGIAYMKVIIDPNTDEILQCLYPGMGNCVSHQLMKADLKEIGRCK